MISIEMAPSQFEEALKLIAADDTAKVDIDENAPTFSGHIHTSQIDADYHYQQRTEDTGTLVFTNEVKHGMYKFVTNDTIGQHIKGLLSKLPPPTVTSVQAAESDLSNANADEAVAPPSSSTEPTSAKLEEVKTPVDSNTTTA